MCKHTQTYLDASKSHLCLKEQEDTANQERGTDIPHECVQGEGHDDLTRGQGISYAHVRQEGDGHEESQSHAKVEGGCQVADQTTYLDQANLMSRKLDIIFDEDKRYFYEITIICY